MVSIRTWFVALALATLESAGAQIGPVDSRATAAKWDMALSFRQFIAADTARRGIWEQLYRDAAPTVDSSLSSARSVSGHFRVLVVAETWCGDARRAVPLLARLADLDSAIELRLLRRADAPELLQAHLLNGRAATPLVLIYDEAFAERGVWIERPATGHAVLEEFLALLERVPQRHRQLEQLSRITTPGSAPRTRDSPAARRAGACTTETSARRS